MITANVPAIFLVPDMYYYPKDNWPDFEFWFLNEMMVNESGSDRIYIPILWTSYLKRNGYGKHVGAIQFLQSFIDSLSSDVKYWTVVQYDDGTVIDWKGKDVVIFSMSGKPEGSIPIPLVCRPHKPSFDGIKKDILCSFVGRITDPVRQQLVDWGKDRKDCYITTINHNLESYCNILARSKFVLCPRGYGASSFRTGESLQYGAMPFLFGNKGDRIFELQLPLFYEFYHEWYSDTHHHDLDRFMREKEIPTFSIYSTYNIFYTFEGLKAYILQKLIDVDSLHS